ncbi:MAG: hypothetical protein PT944_03060 [Actinomycetaceae bacterium]|nr:hypothetical protein [Actinomycetaceae bacterium]MDY5274027.1 hypothetical protein [Arcanobacterium sp.]
MTMKVLKPIAAFTLAASLFFPTFATSALAAPADEAPSPSTPNASTSPNASTTANGADAASEVDQAVDIKELETAWVKSAKVEPTVVNGADIPLTVWFNNNQSDGASGSEKVVFTVQAENAGISSIPAQCKTNDVDPVSAWNDDTHTFTCNMGEIPEGSASKVSVPLRADGVGGSEIAPKVSLGDREYTLEKKTITAATSVDLQSNFPDQVFRTQVANTNDQLEVLVPFIVWIPKGNETLDNTKPVEFDIALTYSGSGAADHNPKVVGQPVTALVPGPAHAAFGQKGNAGKICGALTFRNGLGTANGNFPRTYDRTAQQEQNEQFDCTVTKNATAGSYHVKVTNFNNSLSDRFVKGYTVSRVTKAKDATPVINGAIAFQMNYTDPTTGQNSGSLWKGNTVTNYSFQATTSNFSAVSASGTQLSDSDTVSYDNKGKPLPEAANGGAGSSYKNNSQVFALSPLGDFSAYYWSTTSEDFGVGGNNEWNAQGQQGVGKQVLFMTRAIKWAGLAEGSGPDTAGLCTLFDSSQTIDPAYYPRLNRYDRSYNGTEYPYEFLTLPAGANLDLSSAKCDNDLGTWTRYTSDELSALSSDELAQIRGVRLVWSKDNLLGAHLPDFAPSEVLQMQTVHYINAAGVDKQRIWASGQWMENGTWHTSASRQARQVTALSTIDPATTGVTAPQPFTHTTTCLDTMFVAPAAVTASKSAKNLDDDGSGTLNTGDTIEWTVTGTFNAAEGNSADKMTLTDVLPAGLKLVEGSYQGATYNEATRTLTWEVNKPTVPQGETKVSHTFTYRTVLATSATVRNTIKVKGTGDIFGPEGQFSTASSSASLAPVTAGSTYLEKEVAAKEYIPDGANSWKVKLNSYSAKQNVWDVIDILPFNGDRRGTKYHGTLTYSAVEDVPEGATVYYTTADPATLAGDPADKSNGAFGSVTDGTASWSTDFPADGSKLTGIRLIGKNLAAGSYVEFTVPFTAQGNQVGDKLDNIAYARGTDSKLKMIKSEDTVTVAEKSQLQVNKVLTTNAVKPGGKLDYTITAYNGGKEKATNVVVTDVPGVGIASDSVKLSEPSKGQISDTDSKVWNVGTLNPGETVTAKAVATVETTVAAGEEIINAVIIENPTHPRSDLEGFDPDNVTYIENTPRADDPNGVKHVTTDTDQADKAVIEVTPEDSRLQVNKEITNEPSSRGDTVTYTLTALNAGTDSAHKVVVTDIPGVGVAADSVKLSEPSQGAISEADSKVWNVGTLAPGEQVTTTVTAQVADDAPYGTALVNDVVITNPTHSRDGFDKDVPNTGDVTTDDDQFDRATFAIKEPVKPVQPDEPDKPGEPTPGTDEPDKPGEPTPGADEPVRPGGEEPPANPKPGLPDITTGGDQPSKTTSGTDESVRSNSKDSPADIKSLPKTGMTITKNLLVVLGLLITVGISAVRVSSLRVSRRENK